MKRIIIGCIFLIVIIICIFFLHEIIRTKNIKEYLKKGEMQGEYIFNEDKNITSKTYYISEKKIEIPILLYHEFYLEEPSSDLYGIISTPEKFEKDIMNIIGEGYTFVSLDRIIDYKNGRKGLPENCVVLTFDDGYTSNYEYIYPILKKYNIPATIFIIDDFVGVENYFSWEQAKEMQNSGLVSIYSHGHSHIDMTGLDIEEFKSKTAEAYDNIEMNLGVKKHKVYSYPLGFYNDETNLALKELGFEVFMTTNKGRNTEQQLESGLLNRNYIAYDFSVLKLIKILKLS